LISLIDDLYGDTAVNTLSSTKAGSVERHITAPLRYDSVVARENGAHPRAGVNVLAAAGNPSDRDYAGFATSERNTAWPRISTVFESA
jgi:hypothetical protein